MTENTIKVAVGVGCIVTFWILLALVYWMHHYFASKSEKVKKAAARKAEEDQLAKVNEEVRRQSEARAAEWKAEEAERPMTENTIKVETITTTVTTVRVSAQSIREWVGAPPNAVVKIHIPGGGDWSNEDLDVNESTSGSRVIIVTWKEEK
jgi:Na+-transporting methylmalonyl-CoA/oxaloacetate decarboxylase gamma subunit